MENLKPCPFCGSTKVKSFYGKIRRNKIIVIHKLPCVLAQVNIEYVGGKENYDDLIKAWNTRSFEGNNISLNKVNGNMTINL